ncbi:MAG: metallophosphoesterase [Ruminococcus sp.]|nr:metallophosphoesterase [Ruminococcus sp.]
MVFITGDTHGDFQRLSRRHFPIQKVMTGNNFVIILGDFGGIWAPEETKEEEYWLDWLNENPFDTVFIDGNHENFDRLYHEFEVVNYHGGKAHKIRDRVYHLMRGELFDFESKRFFAIGGAETHDTDYILSKSSPGGLKHFKEVAKTLRKQNIFYRVDGESWWHHELPSRKELDHARQKLDEADWKVDYVLTHCAPTSLFKPLNAVGIEPNELTDFFDEIAKKLDFKNWFFGHHHIDLDVGMFKALYHDTIRIN